LIERSVDDLAIEVERGRERKPGREGRVASIWQDERSERKEGDWVRPAVNRGGERKREKRPERDQFSFIFSLNPTKYKEVPTYRPHS
jgi:hypothetical protein